MLVRINIHIEKLLPFYSTHDVMFYSTHDVMFYSTHDVMLTIPVMVNMSPNVITPCSTITECVLFVHACVCLYSVITHVLG